LFCLLWSNLKMPTILSLEEPFATSKSANLK